MRSQAHDGWLRYLDRKGLNEGERRLDGAVVLVFDERYRVFVRPAQHGDMVLESQLTELPADTRRGDELIDTALRHAASRLEDSTDMLVLSTDERALLLQQRIPAQQASDEFEPELERFVNAIAQWRRCLSVL